MKRKIVIIISDIQKSLQFEWIAKGINNGILEITYILLNEEHTPLEEFLKQNFANVYRFGIGNKLKYIITFLKILFLLNKIRPDVVHSHLRVASIIGGFSSFICRIKKRIYTRHHASYHREYYPKAVWIDRLVNFLHTDIVAISENVKNELVFYEGVSEKKITIINHGLNFNDINNISNDRVEKLRLKYKIGEQALVIGVISRYIHLKGIQFIIPAVAKLKTIHPNIILVLANARGSFKVEIQNLLNENLEKEDFVEIDFEEDLFALYKLFNIYVHVPINKECEAFGQTYIEALACRIPSIFTLSGIANEILGDRINAFVVDHKNSDQIFNAMNLIIDSNNAVQIDLIKEKGYQLVLSKFSIDVTIDKHLKFYN